MDGTTTELPPTLAAVCRGIERYARRLVAVVVHLNDTYIADERPDDGLPGFARLVASVDALRRCTQRHCGEDRVLVLHSGDFLAPSLLSRRDRGQTMTALMNRVGVDFFVPGNHEFDHGQPAFLDCMAQARFKPLLAHGRGPAAAGLHRHVVWPDAQRPWVALTGIVGAGAQPAFGADWSFTDPHTALQAFFADTPDSLHHLVLTHANRDEDLALRDGADFPRRSALLGGHDHDIGFADHATLPLVFKNLSNLKTVRVLLLLAGGDRAVDVLYRRHDDLHDAEGRPPADTAAARRALLAASTAFDREVISDWIEHRDPRIAVAADEVPTRSAASFEQDDALPGNALAWRLDGIPAPADLHWWTLEAGDHPAADANTERRVDEALQRHLQTPDRSLLRDFSACTDAFDARDESLRRAPTDFGNLVADCVRTHAGADVAILNAGSFRADTLLPPRLTVLGLQEAFLYDGPRAVVVYDDVAADWVDELLAAARQAEGEGAYPQVSTAATLPPRCRLAIAGYVFENEKCIDACYLDFLARHWGSVDAGRAALRAQNPAGFGIVDAIKAQIAYLSYRAAAPAGGPRDDATAFVARARELAEAFERQRPYRLEDHAAWFSDFQAFLARDLPSPHGAELDARRDALRAWLRGVSAGRLAPLQMLHDALVRHRSRFDDELDYHVIFKYAATGIAGWRP